MSVQHISAITLAVQDMDRSVDFYQRLGFNPVHGALDAEFSSLRFDNAFVNLQFHLGVIPRGWGRMIFRVDNVRAYHDRLEKAGRFPN